MTVDRGSGP